MRFWPIALPIIILALIPATALGHAGNPGSISITSLRGAAKACATYTPASENRRRRFERVAFGPRHSAEHQRARARDRKIACAPGGHLRKSFVKKMKSRAQGIKRSNATGPTSQVGQWSGPISLPGIVAIHTTLMPNGKVLFFYNNPTFGDEQLGRVMVWDPATQTGVRRDVPANIWCAGQTLLADGRVLVVGGNLQYQTGTSSFKGLNQIWIFNPSTETWTRGPDMRQGRWYPTATRLADGRVLITAGWDESGNGADANNRDLEVYTPPSDGVGPGTVQVVASRDIDYYPHQYVLPDGRVILAGPRDVDTAFLNPATWAFTDIPDLQVNRDYGYGAGVLLPGPASGSTKVLMIGGANGDANLSTATTEQFDAANPSAGWSFKAPLPQSRRNVNGVILPDGKILAVGGNNTGASDNYRFETESYNPATNAWTPLASQSEGRGYHSTAILLPDARVLSAGDDTVAGGGWTSDVAEIFSPPYLFNGGRPAITSAPTSVSYNAAFTIGTGDAVSRAVLVAPGSTTHANDMNQRHVELAFTPTAGGVVATSPPSANVAPPGPYMLFLLNAQGVPSVARFVSVGTGPPPPPDTTAPTVSLSAPAAGASLSGTTPVSANAADNLAVAGVQFTLDGANLGAEDTSAPYSISWNTTTATNGSHTLRAIARDGAGNSTTSGPVAVSVANTAPPPAAGLVGAYGFEETSGTAVTDSSSANNPGTIVGAAARTASGKIGRAIDFDGVNDYVSIADANSLDLTTGMTLEAWVQLDVASSWRTTVLKEKPGGLVYSLYANTSSQRPQGEMVTGAGAGTGYQAGAAPPLTVGTWTHLAVTYDGAQLRLYRNGVLVTSTAAANAIQASANPVRIGGNLIWGEYTDGRIDEVRLYNRALSAGEITSDMTTPVGGGTPPPPDTTAPTVSLSAPAAGASLSGTTPVSANAADNVAVAGVQFTLDGANLGAEDTSAPYSISWNTTTATNGSHTLRAIARDGAGNSTTSGPVAVSVANTAPDTTAPTVSLSAPAAGASLSGTTPVSANAADNLAVAGVQFTLDGANLGAEDTSAPYSISWNTTTATNGSHTLRAIARDGAGNSTTSGPVAVSVANTAPPPAAGLVGAYGFEETSGTAVTDSSSANNPGTIVGAAARTAAGKIGRAIDFDGVNDYVSIADANSLDLTTGMTLEAWVQLDVASSWRTTVLKEKPGGLVYSLYANTSSQRPQGEMVTGAGAGTGYQAGAAPPLTVGTWTHLAVTYDGAQLRLYRNGVLVTSTAAANAIQASANPVRIGGNLIWGEYLDGRIDEVRLYNRALSAGEITSDMTTPVGGGTPPPPDTTAPTVSLSAPAAGASLSGTTPVSANAADNVAVAGVQFTLDGANLGAEDTSAPYSISWNTTTATNGSHTLRAIARDGAGNSTTSGPVAVSVANTAPDTTAPTVSLSAPAAGASLSGTTPVSANAADNLAVAGVQFTLDGANLGAEDTSAPYSISWNTTTATNGSHTLRAIARDGAGNSTTSGPVAVSVANTAPPPAAGLVGAYGFEETSGTAVTDSSSANNPGTIVGAAARTASGKIGRAIDFDGVNDYVSIADANSLDLTTGMTLEAWVQLDVASSWRTTVLKEKPGGLVYSLYANTSSQRPQGEMVTGAGAGTGYQAGAAPPLTVGTWTHLAVTYDGAQLRLYRNGVLVTSTAAANAIQASANPVRIGGNLIWGEYLDGRIDEVRLYNRALSAGEITSDMTTPVV